MLHGLSELLMFGTTATATAAAADGVAQGEEALTFSSCSGLIMFLGGIILLVAGYYTYGRFIEKLIGVDDRPTPGVLHPDGVDYVVIPHWKNMLIQLLNIAGIGPVIGVILGIKFGAVALIIIPLGNIFGGAVHDFLGGMMSIRDNGANLPKIIKDNLGVGYARFFSVFMVFLLLLVVAVFINVPARLSDGMILPDSNEFWICVGVIFAYYVAATLFPVDKIIGNVYPFFGLMLLIGTGAIFVMILGAALNEPLLLEETEAFKTFIASREGDNPIMPLLFVTIACGIISGFHATQAPIVARTMKTEREARSNFYGMMIVEGIIAMIWAAGALAIFRLFPAMIHDAGGTDTLKQITTHFLGKWMGGITLVAVIILAITSGDTALRSLRLSLAEMFSIEQKSIVKRIFICLPLILCVGLLLWWSNSSQQSFKYLWNYFAWGNQVLAASTLMAGAVWLIKQGKNPAPALLPGMFMSFIVVTFILWTSTAHHQPYGLGLELDFARSCGLCAALAFAVYACFRGYVFDNPRFKQLDMKK